MSVFVPIECRVTVDTPEQLQRLIALTDHLDMDVSFADTDNVPDNYVQYTFNVLQLIKDREIQLSAVHSTLGRMISFWFHHFEERPDSRNRRGINDDDMAYMAVLVELYRERMNVALGPGPGPSVKALGQEQGQEQGQGQDVYSANSVIG
jgi:hypothetical protein